MTAWGMLPVGSDGVTRCVTLMERHGLQGRRCMRCSSGQKSHGDAVHAPSTSIATGL
ncbi:hypothetical protein P4479_04900 [Brevibacillus agri]|uniref:hypothetical protein n=1 Tax=Brevibacillus agri TaxID=51101 RepID=UPI002E236699|nr:hypothetical protein [Brevibacillus agri]